MLAAYRQHAAERHALGIPPLPLDARQTAALIELIKAPPAGEEQFLLELLQGLLPLHFVELALNHIIDFSFAKPLETAGCSVMNFFLNLVYIEGLCPNENAFVRVLEFNLYLIRTFAFFIASDELRES